MDKRDQHDPVVAISEAEATGETAAIFADIRQTMQIPLVTSIWRTLVDIEGGLIATWEIAKPLFETGQPAAALLKLKTQVVLPVPEPLAPGQLSCAGVSEDELPLIRALIGAYNRSNGMNLMALSALIITPAAATLRMARHRRIRLRGPPCPRCSRRPILPRIRGPFSGRLIALAQCPARMGWPRSGGIWPTGPACSP